ncbi:MAG: hypothetical protein COA36_08890 [Desulfotalea sp.]|nr:MAG: hypothetical protein COA36_08890 [Desulfotalea sp.]
MIDLEKYILVVVPAKNEERYIKCCLDAVLCQDYSSFNVVVVDNGSVDKTVKIVKQIPEVVLLKKKDGTISSLRNFGAKYASSKYIAFLDGDSVPPSSWLKTGIEVIQDEKVSCVGFSASRPDARACWVVKTWALMSSSAKHNRSCYVHWLSSFNLIIERKAFEKIGGFDESLETCEDYDLGLRLSKFSRLFFSDSLSVEHLGVVSSLREFFQKELWRGKSNFQQLKISRDGLVGLLGVIVPFCYLVFSIMLIVISFWNLQVLLLFVVLFGFPLVFACRRLKSVEQVRFLPKMLVLASVYLYARGMAIFWR